MAATYADFGYPVDPQWRRLHGIVSLADRTRPQHHRSMLMSLLLLAGWQVPTAAPTSSGLLFHDDERQIDVLYDRTGDQVTFSSNLPVGWSLEISVDVDQNRIWGAGRYDPTVIPDTADRSYGINSSDDMLCPQMVYHAKRQDRDRIMSASSCGGVPSAGYIRVGPVGDHDRAMFSIVVPASELFAGRDTAHLQVCIWDRVRMQCAYSPRRPFILSASTAPPTQ